MSIGADFLALEKGFWLNGADHFRTHMGTACTMVFPEPVGVLEGEAIIAALEGVPRWSGITFGEWHCTGTGDVAVLAYRAVATREGEPQYSALCSSTYLKSGGGWQMIQHQQTPI